MFTNVVKHDHQLAFDFSGVDVSVANAIRRVVISEVPTVAFAFDPNAKQNDIVITKNTGALHNEFLGHRISLLPLHFTVEELENFDPSHYTFTLKAKNETDAILNVTSADIEIFDQNGKKYDDRFHKRIFPSNMITNDHVLITQLKPNLFDKNKGDEIELKAIASRNIGKVHSRWCPVSVCTYHNILDADKVENGLEKYIKEHQSQGLSDEELRRRFKTLEMYRYFKTNKYEEPDAFHFIVESECGVAPEYIVKKAIEIIIEKLKKIAVNIKERNGVKIEQSQGMSYIILQGEDHTMGNLVQAMMYNLFIREDASEDKQITYIGYQKPHPLEDNIIIKVKTDKDVPVVMEHGIMKIAEYMNTVLHEWNVVAM